MRNSCLRILVCCLCAALLLPALATPADQAFMTARQLLETGHEAQAAAGLKKFLADFPDDPRQRDAAFMLGRCYQQEKQYEPALAAYDRVIELTAAPEQSKLRAETYFHQAECAYQLKNYENAARAYAASLKTSTADADLAARAQYWLGDSLYRAGHTDEALREYRKVIDMAPTHQLAPWSLYAVGMLELNRGQYAPAITALERVQTQFPEVIDAGEIKLDCGLAYAGRAGQGKDADDVKHADALLSAVAADDKAAAASRQEAARALAQMYMDVQQYPRAATAYAQVLALLPPDSAGAVDAHLQRGHALYNNGQFSEACAEYARVAENKIAPAPARTACYWLGNSWFQQAQKTHQAAAAQAAVSALTRFLADAPPDAPQAPRATLLLALSYEDLAAQAGGTSARAGAVAAYKDLLAKWPASREAGQAHAGIMRLSATMTSAELEQVAGSLPDGAAAWNVALQLAREQYLAGKYPEAIATAQKVLEGKPDAELSGGAHFLIGACYQRLDRPAEAIPHYKLVLGHATGDLLLCARRGLTRAYLDTRQFPEARESARALGTLPVAETEPAAAASEQAERLTLLAEACVGAQQYPEALDAYARIGRDFPGTAQAPYALMGIAWIAETRKDQPAAIAAYRDMLAKFPAHKLAADAAFRLGMALNEQKDFTQAIAALKMVPNTYPLADQAAYTLAWAYQDAGQPAEANAQFARLAEQFPKSELAGDSLFRIGEYWFAQKNYPEAARAYGRALEALGATGKLGPLAAYKLGVSALNAGDAPGAAEAFTKLLARYPTSELAAEALFWRAQALERQGAAQAAAAREAYRQYVGKYPAGPLAADAACGAGRTGVATAQYPAARADLQKALALCDQCIAGQDATLADRAKNVQPEAQYWLGECALGEKKYDDAIAAYAAVAAYPLEPWYSRSILQMARCSALAGDKPAAERTLQLLQDKFPASAPDAKKLAEEFGLKLAP